MIPQLKALSPWKFLQLDTGDEQSINNVAVELKDVPIDLLINNAGIFEGGGLEVTTKADLMHQFEIDVTGPFLTTRVLLPNLKLAANEKGCAIVVQLSSSMGSISLNTRDGMPESPTLVRGVYGYRAVKTALNMVNKSLAVDLKHDKIICLAMHPGYVATDMTHYSGLISQTESIAGMVKGIAAPSLDDSGMFVNYQGQVMPW